jgi:hypothetical protein
MTAGRTPDVVAHCADAERVGASRIVARLVGEHDDEGSLLHLSDEAVASGAPVAGR